MRKIVVTAVMTSASALVLLAGCSSPEPEVAPSQFCNDVQVWQNASLETAKDAIHSGDFASEDLQQSFAHLIEPLQQVQSSVPIDAPPEVQQAVDTYLLAMTDEAFGTAPDVANSPQETAEALDSSPSSDFSSTDPGTSTPGSVEDPDPIPAPETYSDPDSTSPVSNAELQAAARTLRAYIDEQCPTTLPSDGSQP